MASAAARATRRRVLTAVNDTTEAANTAIALGVQTASDWRAFKTMGFWRRMLWLATGRMPLKDQDDAK